MKACRLLGTKDSIALRPLGPPCLSSQVLMMKLFFFLRVSQRCRLVSEEFVEHTLEIKKELKRSIPNQNIFIKDIYGIE